MKRASSNGHGEVSEGDLGEELLAVVTKIVRAEIAKERAPLRTAPETERMLTVKQAANRLGMSVSYVRTAIRDERLPAVRIGRSVRLHASDVDALPASRTSTSTFDPAERAARLLGIARR